jgi:hypothetical protein
VSRQSASFVRLFVIGGVCVGDLWKKKRLRLGKN